MNTMIYNPLEEYISKFQGMHLEKTNAFFDALVQESNINIEENRKTVKQYNTYKDNLAKLKKKFNLFRFLRVLMIITILLIPLVIMKMTPRIKELRKEIELADQKVDELYHLAIGQMNPLNELFTEKDALNLVETTIPQLNFAQYFSPEHEMDMRINYDFDELRGNQMTTLDVLAGWYNENPFVFEKKRVHTMGTATYHGSKTISWTETYRDSNGKMCTRTRTQTLQASVVKPKPFYRTEIVLYYGAQGGPELSFSRDATHLEKKSEREIERYVKKGEKKLKKMTDKAISENKDFTSMSNSDFEVLFDALDRTNEVQFRTLFTPLAQTNMVDLIRSEQGYGDDFNFKKKKRMNEIRTNHSRNRELNLLPNQYASYSYDIIKENFVQKNAKFFKDIYFDLAPLLAIPIYQERPVHSLKPIQDYAQICSYKECEALANQMNIRDVAHPNTKTSTILQATFGTSQNQIDETIITAHSYDIAKRVDVVSVYGGDGRYHNVSVPWDEYLPLEMINHFYVAEEKTVQNENIMAKRRGLCIFNNNGKNEGGN